RSRIAASAGCSSTRLNESKPGEPGLVGLTSTHQAGFQPAYFHSAEGLSPRRGPQMSLPALRGRWSIGPTDQSPARSRSQGEPKMAFKVFQPAVRHRFMLIAAASVVF